MREFCTLIVSYTIALVVVASPPDPQKFAEQIDARLDDRLKSETVKAAPPADDCEFLRRAYLDLTGRIPLPREVYDFLADKSVDKRAKLIDELLETPRFASHQAAVWRAILTPETTAIPDARVFRPGFEAWLRLQFRKNAPYDSLVRELLTTPLSTESDNPTPVLRRPDDPNPMAFFAVKEAKPENLAAATTRVFLGVRIECAQCHNHPMAKWTREQFWNQAAFFAGVERNGDGLFAPISERLTVRGIAFSEHKERIPPLFLNEAAPAKNARLRTELAEWITRKDNPFFARAAVNRVWGQFFGRGLVDPVDDFNDDNLPSHPELLNDMANAFTDAGYDLRFLVRSICRTKAYQRTSARSDLKQDDPKQFAKMAVRGLSGEQLFDSLSRATGLREGNGRGSAREQFLNRFPLGGKPAEPETSIPQALALMNGTFIADATTLKTSPTLTAACELPGLKPDERVEMLYLSALGRKPATKELDRVRKHLEDAGQDRFAERLGDVFWALLNSAEFRLNH